MLGNFLFTVLFDDDVGVLTIVERLRPIPLSRLRIFVPPQFESHPFSLSFHEERPANEWRQPFLADLWALIPLLRLRFPNF